MKSFTAITAVAGLLGAVKAVPASKQPSYVNDAFILNYALTLEHLGKHPQLFSSRHVLI